MTSSTDVLVRAATKDDIEALGTYGTMLMALHHEWDPARFISPDNKTPAGYAKWLGSQLAKDDIVVLVAERAGSPVGYTYAGVEGFDYMALRGPAGVLYDIFVDPACRKEGIGRALLLATVEALTARGADKVVLNTASRNHAAQQLFASAGFRSTMIEMTRNSDAPAT